MSNGIKTFLILAAIIVTGLLVVFAVKPQISANPNNTQPMHEPAASNLAPPSMVTDGTEKPNPAVGNSKTEYTVTGIFTNSKKHDVVCFSPDPDDSTKLTGDSSEDFCFTNQEEAHALFQLQNTTSLYSDSCLWIEGRANITITNYANPSASHTAGARLLKVNQIITQPKCST